MKFKYLFLIILITSCGKKTERVKDEYEIKAEKRQRTDSINQLMTVGFFKNNNAIDIEDSIFNYTFQIQEKYEASNFPIALNGHVRDIFKKDSTYIILIDCDYGRNSCLARIIVSKEQLKGLTNFKKRDDGHFVVIPTSIKANSLLDIDSYADEVNEGEQAESHLTYDFKEVILLIKGNLKDYLYDRDSFPILSNLNDTNNPKKS